MMVLLMVLPGAVGADAGSWGRLRRLSSEGRPGGRNTRHPGVGIDVMDRL